MKISISEAYGILGVKQPTNLKEVKKRVRLLAKKFHPDVNHDKNATQQFQEIYMAYETILKSLGESIEIIESEIRNNSFWFYKWCNEGRIKADMDPFEVRYEHYWVPKIAKMIENLKKQK